jgi:hypothetical protein
VKSQLTKNYPIGYQAEDNIPFLSCPNEGVSGMAVEFQDVSSEDSEVLKAYILELLTRDILEEQEEPVITKNHRIIYF